MSTEIVTVNFTPPSQPSGGSAEYSVTSEDGKSKTIPWVPAPIEPGKSRSYKLQQGETNGYLLWGISFWGEVRDPGDSTVIKTNLAKVVMSWKGDQTAYISIGGNQYKYVTGITVSNDNKEIDFTVHNNNPDGWEGVVCFEVTFTDSDWHIYYTSRDPEIPLRKDPDPDPLG